jgi:hypothetical protein
VCLPGTVSAAVFGLADQAWRTIDLPDQVAAGDWQQPRNFLGVTTDGRVVLEAVTGTTEASQAFWTYQPEGDVWTQLPSPGVENAGGCLAGDHLIVASGTETAEGYGNLRVHSLALDEPGASWVRGEPARGVELMSSGAIVCGPSFVLMSDFTALDPLDPVVRVVMLHHAVPDVTTGGWAEIPLSGDFLADAAEEADDRLVLIDGRRALAIGPGPTATSFEVPHVPHDFWAVWTGDDLVLISRRDSRLRTAAVP